jgi:hypothetical protein
MARKRGKKRLVDCSVECSKSGRHDFNVWPCAGETDREACLRRAKDFMHAVDDCGVLRARGIDGIGSPQSDDLTAAGARALRACKSLVDEGCQDACRTGIVAYGRQLQKELPKKTLLDGAKPGRIIRET